jgi:hypothetical protein
MDSIKKADKKTLLEALEKNKGIVSISCASIGYARSTYYDWLNSDEEFKAAVADINETAIDFVESKLMEKVNGVVVRTFNEKREPKIYDLPPSDTAIIFFLKTRGKKRGYVERMEVDNMNAIMLMQLDPLSSDADTSTNDSPTQNSGS